MPAQVAEPSGDSIGVSFHPPASGEYELEAYLEKDGKQAKIADTPQKFSVKLPEKKPGMGREEKKGTPFVSLQLILLTFNLAEEQVQKAADETTVDFSGLSAEPTEDGGVSFNVNGGKKLPDGAKYDAKILFVPDHSSKLFLSPYLTSLSPFSNRCAAIVALQLCCDFQKILGILSHPQRSQDNDFIILADPPTSNATRCSTQHDKNT